MHRTRVAILALLLASFRASMINAQSSATTSSGLNQSAAPSAPVKNLYWAFFHNVADLEREAQEAEKSGKDGTGIREYYKRKLKLTDAEHIALRTVASDSDGATKAQDEAAKKVIDTARKQLADQSKISGATLPPPPPELFQLQSQRDGIILAHIDQLKTAMGAAGFQKVDTFVNTAFAIKATTQSVRLPTRVRSLPPPSRNNRVEGKQ